MSDNDDKRYFSNSEVQTYKRCQRKWWLEWYRGLRLKHTTPVGALAIGTRIHAALAAWYVPEGTPRAHPMDTLNNLLKIDRSLFISSLTVDPTYEEDTILSAKAKQFDNEANLQRAMISGYMDHVAETGIDSGLTIVAPETIMNVHLWGNYYAIGILDARALRSIDGARVFIDHKTVQNFTQPLAMINSDQQMLHYFMLESMTPTENPNPSIGVEYNMLRKVKRTAAAKPPFYQRTPIMFNGHQIAAYKRHLFSTIHQIINTQAEVKQWGNEPNMMHMLTPPTPTRDCSWQCPFVSICPMFDDGSRVEDMIKTYYVEGNPLDRYHKDPKSGMIVIDSNGSESGD